MALGELGLTIEQFGMYTVGQINALTRGYLRRRDAEEDLFIAYSALPTYQTQMGRKAPTYQKLTAHRRKRQHVGGLPAIPQDELEKWRLIL